ALGPLGVEDVDLGLAVEGLGAAGQVNHRPWLQRLKRGLCVFAEGAALDLAVSIPEHQGQIGLGVSGEQALLVDQKQPAFEWQAGPSRWMLSGLSAASRDMCDYGLTRIAGPVGQES